jgi:hypothetical protein
MILFSIKLNNNSYNVFVVNENQNKNKFFNEVEQLTLSPNRNIKLCFDYEFNFNKIGIAQLLISEKNISNNVYIFDPKQFNDKETQFIKNNLYLNNYPKILHGSESLDIPYILNNVLHKNYDDINKFLSTVTDTRFKCELTGNKKCSLYEILYSSGSINDKQYNFLQKLYKTNGKVYKIKWNTRNLNINQYMYAAFDVIFLRRLDRILNKEINKIGYNKNLLDEYVRFTLLFRNGYIKINNINIDLNQNYSNKIYSLQYLKNPILSLIKSYKHNNNKIINMLDKLKFNLIKADLDAN